ASSSRSGRRPTGRWGRTAIQPSCGISSPGTSGARWPSTSRPTTTTCATTSSATGQRSSPSSGGSATSSRATWTRSPSTWPRTGDYWRDRGRFEAVPLVVDGTLYVSTPVGRVIALDPARGTERWRYDARVSLEGDYGDFANRGVSTWLDPAARPDTQCRRRV